jgi:mannose-6-phosphate isomerase
MHNRDTPLYPLALQAALHPRVWGGRRLADSLEKDLPTAEPYGESWELHESVIIANGPLRSRTLGELIARYGADMLGADADPAQGLPLVAKFLDASDWLSVQVHPDDAQARALEGKRRGQSEAWYVLAAEPGARLITGLRPSVVQAEIIDALEQNRLAELLVFTEVQAGDVLNIPAGTIHALGAGILVYEIQQASDTTYRFYDWGRTGLDGRPRELHIEKSLAVASLDRQVSITHVDDEESHAIEVVRTDHFVTFLHQLNPRNGAVIDLDTRGRTFHALTCIEGQATVEAGPARVELAAGQTIFVPASVGPYRLAGSAQVMRSSQP